MNKSYKTVWNRATRTYVAASETAKSRGAKGVSVCGMLVAASAGLLSALVFAQPVEAQTVQTVRTSETLETSQTTEAVEADDLARTVGQSGAPAATQSPLKVNQLNLLAASAPPVTDYISVSPNVVQGTRTSASTDLNAMAIGPTAAATAINALAVGAGSAAGSVASTAVGQGAGALSTNSTVVGAGSSVGMLSDNSVAIGYNARSSAFNTMSIGAFASATGTGSVAIGYSAFVNPSATNGMAFGANASVSGTNSVALGGGSIADRVNAVAVGSNAQRRQLVYVAAGTQTTDAVNLGQLAGAVAALGGGAMLDPGGTVVAPAYDVGGKTYHDVGAALAAIATGSAAGSADALRYDTAKHDVATLGNANVPVKLANLADATLSADSSEAVTGAQLYGTNQAVAQNAADIANLDSDLNRGKTGLVRQNAVSRDLSVGQATDGQRVDFGGTAGSRELTGVAAGAAAESAVNLGQLSPVVAALGGGASVSANGTVTGPTYHVQAGTQTTVGSALNALDTGLTSVQKQVAANLVTQHPQTQEIMVGATTGGDRVNLAGTAGNRVVSGVANGRINSISVEAVNGSQLYANAASTAAALGGGTIVNMDGTVQAPSYTVGGATYHDVGAALAAAVTTSAQAGADAVQYDSNAHDSVTLGTSAKPVRVTNVRAGKLAVDSAEAVNGAQLFSTNQAVAQNTGSITNLDQRVTDNTTAISNLDARTTTIEGDVTHITNQINNGEIGLVQQDAASRNLTVAKDTDGARIDFSGSGGARELTGVAAGITDTSAINLTQFRPMVAALGGGAQLNADGSLTGPTYHVQGGTQSTVGDALGSLDSGLSTLQQDMASGGIGLVTQDPLSRVINVGSATDGALINLAGTSGNRVVTGVARGAIGATSSDAVNGSQLYAQAASTAAALGGGASVNPDGSLNAPSYSVGGTVVNNVGSAIGNLDSRVTQNSNAIDGLQTTIGNLNGAVANAVQYDSAAHDRITLGGTAANTPAVRLTNLQDGELSATSTDAVTGAQLWQTNQQIGLVNQAVQNVQTNGNAYVSVNSAGNAAQAIGNGSVAIGGGAVASAPNAVALGEGSIADQTGTVSVGSAGSERRITNVANGQAPTDAVNMRQFQGGMNEIARNAYSGTASAIALTMVPEVDTSKNLAIGVGTAGYKGYQAVAVGLSARVTQNLKVKLGAGISAATTTVGAGAAYQW
nr:Autotransporter adhesin SadA [Paraburkholderia busanensis]